MNETNRLGNVYGDEFGTGYAGNVWNDQGLSPTLMNMQGGGRQPHIIEIKDLTKECEGKCLAEQSRAEQLSLCSPSNERRLHSLPGRGGGRSELSRFQDSQRKSPGERTDMPNTDNGEYP